MSAAGAGPPNDDDARLVDEPEPAPSDTGPAPVVSQRALALVAAFSVAQRNVSQAMHAGLDEQLRAAKREHVRAYHALLAYIRELEGLGP
ncbi:MAG TPA: hypothetical protein VFJ74_03280 [Gemmatimonadaceae bacterium]|nr:hypothetical protein [Gemmatimonadaceae bacterium]